MDAAYSLDGSYIGDPAGYANRLWEKYGITHWECPYWDESQSPDQNVCAMGFSPKSQEWYGWSHRALGVLGIGHVVEPGDIGTDFIGPGSGDVKRPGAWRKAASRSPSIGAQRSLARAAHSGRDGA